MRKKQLERLIAEMSDKVGSGQTLLPWPELPHNLAYIAWTLDALRGHSSEPVQEVRSK